jgi:hypothetical protein
MIYMSKRAFLRMLITRYYLEMHVEIHDKNAHEQPQDDLVEYLRVLIGNQALVILS